MPYKDNEKRLAYQREYEARMRADKGPKGEAWRSIAWASREKL